MIIVLLSSHQLSSENRTSPVYSFCYERSSRVSSVTVFPKILSSTLNKKIFNEFQTTVEKSRWCTKVTMYQTKLIVHLKMIIYCYNM